MQQPSTLPAHVLGRASGVPVQCPVSSNLQRGQDQMRSPCGTSRCRTGLATAMPDARPEAHWWASPAVIDLVSGAAPAPQPSKSAEAAGHTLHPAVKALVCASFRSNRGRNPSVEPWKRNHSAPRPHPSARNGGGCPAHVEHHASSTPPSAPDHAVLASSSWCASIVGPLRRQNDVAPRLGVEERGTAAAALAHAACGLQVHPSERWSYLSRSHAIELAVRVPYSKAIVKLSSLTAQNATVLELGRPARHKLWFLHAFASELRATVASSCRYECAFRCYRTPFLYSRFLTHCLHTILVATFRLGVVCVAHDLRLSLPTIRTLSNLLPPPCGPPDRLGLSEPHLHLAATPIQQRSPSSPWSTSRYSCYLEPTLAFYSGRAHLPPLDQFSLVPSLNKQVP